jgi:hypothetical protein
LQDCRIAGLQKVKDGSDIKTFKFARLEGLKVEGLKVRRFDGYKA